MPKKLTSDINLSLYVSMLHVLPIQTESLKNDYHQILSLNEIVDGTLHVLLKHLNQIIKATIF